MRDELRLAEPDAARDAHFVERVKTALDLPADARLELQRATEDAQGRHTVEYTIAQPIEIQGAEFGAADGVTVEEQRMVSLLFDARGALVSSQVSPIDERHLRLVKDQIRKLAAANAIGPAPSGEVSDADALPAVRRPWYIEMDEEGRKRLKRAHFG